MKHRQTPDGGARIKRLIAFAIVGGAGFTVDIGVLSALLEWTRTDKYSARILAIGLALLVTWSLNRHFTFGRSGSHVAVEGAKYGTVAILGNLLNFAVYSGALLAFPRLSPLIAVIFGSASGTIFAYNGYTRIVFRR